MINPNSKIRNIIIKLDQMNLNLATSGMASALSQFSEIGINPSTLGISSALSQFSETGINPSTLGISSALSQFSEIGINPSTLGISSALSQFSETSINPSTLGTSSALNQFSEIGINPSIAEMVNALKTLNGMDSILNIQKLSNVFIENNMYKDINSIYNTVKGNIDLETKSLVENELSKYENNEVISNKSSSSFIRTHLLTILFIIFIAMQVNSTSDKIIHGINDTEISVTNKLSFPIIEVIRYREFYMLFNCIKKWLDKDEK